MINFIKSPANVDGMASCQADYHSMPFMVAYPETETI
jgi:hypothetical protein